MRGWLRRRTCVGSRVLTNVGDVDKVNGLDQLSQEHQVRAGGGRGWTLCERWRAAGLARERGGGWDGQQQRSHASALPCPALPPSV